MWIPDWLYERLPVLYLVCACTCLWALGDSFVVKMSALMFFGAAALTYVMRRNARRPVVARKRLQPRRR